MPTDCYYGASLAVFDIYYCMEHTIEELFQGVLKHLDQAQYKAFCGDSYWESELISSALQEAFGANYSVKPFILDALRSKVQKTLKQSNKLYTPDWLKSEEEPVVADPANPLEAPENLEETAMTAASRRLVKSGKHTADDLFDLCSWDMLENTVFLDREQCKAAKCGMEELLDLLGEVAPTWAGIDSLSKLKEVCRSAKNPAAKARLAMVETAEENARFTDKFYNNFSVHKKVASGKFPVKSDQTGREHIADGTKYNDYYIDTTGMGINHVGDIIEGIERRGNQAVLTVMCSDGSVQHTYFPYDSWMEYKNAKNEAGVAVTDVWITEVNPSYSRASASRRPIKSDNNYSDVNSFVEAHPFTSDQYRQVENYLSYPPGSRQEVIFRRFVGHPDPSTSDARFAAVCKATLDKDPSSFPRIMGYIDSRCTDEAEEIRNKYSDDEDDIYSSKHPIQSDLKRDIQKMIEYRQKGSNPEALARSVKDMDKAKNRLAIAKAMGWSAAEDAFFERLMELGASNDDIMTIPEVDLSEVSDSVNKATSVGATGKRSLPAPLDRYLRSLGLSYEMESLSPTKQAYYKDLSNGRRYTIMYKVTVSNGAVFYFVNHSNEGGGTYGYSLADDPNNSWLGEDLSISKCLERLKRILPENQAVASSKKPIKSSLNRQTLYVYYNKHGDQQAEVGYDSDAGVYYVQIWDKDGDEEFYDEFKTEAQARRSVKWRKPFLEESTDVLTGYGIESSKRPVKSGMGYNLGFRAALEGKTTDDNPFKHGKPGSNLAKVSADWLKGFDAGCEVPPGEEQAALARLNGDEDWGEAAERRNGLREMYSSFGWVEYSKPSGKIWKSSDDVFEIKEIKSKGKYELSKNYDAIVDTFDSIDEAKNRATQLAASRNLSSSFHDPVMEIEDILTERAAPLTVKDPQGPGELQIAWNDSCQDPNDCHVIVRQTDTGKEVPLDLVSEAVLENILVQLYPGIDSSKKVK